jgi:hypothetical protein
MAISLAVYYGSHNSRTLFPSLSGVGMEGIFLTVK